MEQPIPQEFGRPIPFFKGLQEIFPWESNSLKFLWFLFVSKEPLIKLVVAKSSDSSNLGVLGIQTLACLFFSSWFLGPTFLLLPPSQNIATQYRKWHYLILRIWTASCASCPDSQYQIMLRPVLDSYILERRRQQVAVAKAPLIYQCAGSCAFRKKKYLQTSTGLTCSIYCVLSRKIQQEEEKDLARETVRPSHLQPRIHNSSEIEIRTFRTG